MSDRVFNLLLSMLTVAWAVYIFMSVGWLAGLVFTLTIGAIVLRRIEIATHSALKVILVIVWASGMVIAIIFLAIGVANAD